MGALQCRTMTEATEDTTDQAVTAYALLGGEARVRELVDRFYDLMDLEPEYTELRAAHGTTLDEARDKLFWFLSGWLARHLPFSIGVKERDQWVNCMSQAMIEVNVPATLKVRLDQAFMQTADWMRNRNDI